LLYRFSLQCWIILICFKGTFGKPTSDPLYPEDSSQIHLANQGIFSFWLLKILLVHQKHFLAGYALNTEKKIKSAKVKMKCLDW